jgi:hypothetical protein
VKKCKCGEEATARCKACKKLLCKDAWHFRVKGYCQLNHDPDAGRFFRDIYPGDPDWED